MHCQEGGGRGDAHNCIPTLRPRPLLRGAFHGGIDFSGDDVRFLQFTSQQLLLLQLHSMFSISIRDKQDQESEPL